MTIDTERLSVLLDLGETKVAAARQSRAANSEDEALRKEVRADLADAERKAQHSDLPQIAARARNLRERLAAIEARLERRKAALPVHEERAQLWISYMDRLRTLAQQYGVTTE